VERRAFLAILVATLGYFVDVYDLILFSVLRQASLSDLGYGPKEIEDYGIFLINLQMIGKMP